MDMLYQALKVLSILLFLFYGVSVLVSDAMVEEFQRFNLLRYRKLTGVLEVLGALGLIVGYVQPYFVVIAAGGLTLLMALGVVVRFRCRDSVVDALPAFVMMVMNLFIVVHALGLPVSAR